MTWLRRLLLVLAVAVVAFLVHVGRYVAKAGPVGTGYKAKVGCSAVFVAGREADVVKNADLVLGFPLEEKMSFDVDRDAKTASSSLLGLFRQTAVYREGLGCTLLAGRTPDELAVSTGLPPSPVLPEDVPWPLGRAEIGELPPEVDADALSAALDDAFSEPDPDAPRRTRAVAVVWDGQLVAERYAASEHGTGESFSRSSRLLGWSMTKSVTNALVGILVGQGRLDVDAPAPVPEWRGDSRSAITLDQLLRMSSGLDFEEVYVPGSDASRMLFASPDAASFAAAKPLACAPDECWSYSSGTSNLVARIVRQAVEEAGEDVLSFPRRALFNPVGATSALVETDATGTWVGSSFSYATARDWARLGQLYLQDGVWNGERVLPEGWVAYSVTPTPKAPKGRYGAHFWLNAGTSEDPSSRPWPELPADLFWMSGYEGQSVVVVPSRQAVIVRLGLSQSPSSWRLGEFLGRVLESLPAESPAP